jgi:ribosomal protein S27E
MTVTLYLKSVQPAQGFWLYTALCDNGVDFIMQETSYLGPTGTRIDLPEDMCAIDSGWIEWQCDNCKLIYCTRTRPGGVVHCPLCQHTEICPEGVEFMLEEKIITEVKV